jgi:hypothetical protein
MLDLAGKASSCSERSVLCGKPLDRQPGEDFQFLSYLGAGRIQPEVQCSWKGDISQCLGKLLLIMGKAHIISPLPQAVDHVTLQHKSTIRWLKDPAIIGKFSMKYFFPSPCDSHMLSVRSDPAGDQPLFLERFQPAGGGLGTGPKRNSQAVGGDPY